MSLSATPSLESLERILGTNQEKCFGLQKSVNTLRNSTDWRKYPVWTRMRYGNMEKRNKPASSMFGLG
jgi:hypothetical protein